MGLKFILIQALVYFRGAVVALITIRVLMSWFRPRSWNRQTQWFFRAEEAVWRLTEPLLAPFRNLLPTGGIGLDFSPIIAIFVVDLGVRLAVSIVARLPIP
ncbi:YggT family protein [Caldinitratiruptor microaerophilus]|uniref:YggT family protein n=1 Tax=Caldinitratiruptor microaerophilus TaxID=671077 RepID=A0AA35G9X8_9FIRM|nr:YggT family protein [Caldinitratiruptor microaerophilus]BDG60739.1 YggT family protein [Caldinitratiruptor microaerophilus]